MVEPALDTVTGLSRYRPAGRGIPPETEASHFTHLLQPYATKLGKSVNEYIDGYNDGSIQEPELDEYFLHDRGVRESGHDTSYRLEKKCADLATIDLNSLLYKARSLSLRRCMANYGSTRWISPLPLPKYLEVNSSSKKTSHSRHGPLAPRHSPSHVFRPSTRR